METLELIGGFGFVDCKSSYYTAKDGLAVNKSKKLHKGLNVLQGAIDSGVWALSYFVSMYCYRKRDFILDEFPKIYIGEKEITIKELSEISCYLDELSPIFREKAPVNTLVDKALKKTGMDYSAEQIKDIFGLDNERYSRSLKEIGNERYQAMAAVSFCMGKQIFCFPWLSRTRYEYYRVRIDYLTRVLEDLKCIIIMPLDGVLIK